MKQEKIQEMEELLYQKFREVELEAVKEFAEKLKEKNNQCKKREKIKQI